MEDGKLIDLPKPKREKADPSKVLYLKSVQQAYIIDLVETRRQISKIQKEVARIKSRLLLKVITNADDKGKS